MQLIIIALLTAISLIILLIKFFGWKRVLKFHKSIDILATIAFGFFFMGTFSGMATGIMAGVLLSVFLGAANLITKGFRIE